MIPEAGVEGERAGMEAGERRRRSLGPGAPPGVPAEPSLGSTMENEEVCSVMSRGKS